MPLALKNLSPDLPELSVSPSGNPEANRLFSPECLAFLAGLQAHFGDTRETLLHERRQQHCKTPGFLEHTASVRETEWLADAIPTCLQDRRVEITGPVDAKTVINALNCEAQVFMADFEDSTAPAWETLLAGQVALHGAVRGTLTWSPEGESEDKPAYRLNPEHSALLMVRPRGLHLPERHALLDGVPMSGLLFDLGVFAFHNAHVLAAKQRGPFFYIPKLQSYAEAQWIDAVLGYIEASLGLHAGQIKVTVLIETLPAAFQMHEIIHALKTRIVGLNCGRWDYIFSAIKSRQHEAGFLLPERAQVGMTTPFLNQYARLLIQTCHRRGILAMGGMAAQIPNRRDPAANAIALNKVRADKQREAELGHDGTWVAHPGLIPVARAVFDAVMPGKNQLYVIPDGEIGERDLLSKCSGSITPEGFANTVEVCVRYMAAWLSGSGCVAIHGLMEDAATAEICRSQLWLWLRREDVHLSDGTLLSWALFDAALLALPNKLAKEAITGHHKISDAIQLLDRLVRAEHLEDFLTLPAYSQL